MKRNLLIICALVTLPVHAQEFLQATLIKVKNNELVSCYIVAADKDSIKFSLNESGTSSTSIAKKEIKEIAVQPPVGWDVLQTQYLRGQYEAAIPQLQKTADKYAPLAALENSVGVLARYYQMISLIKVGRFRELPPIYDKVQYSPLALSAAYQAQNSVLPAWAEAGKENWPGVLAAVAKFEVKGGAGPAAPPFTKDFPNELQSQLAMLRAVAHDQLGHHVPALNDYGRAIVLDAGANAWVTKSALGASLRIVHELIEKAGDEASIELKNEAHSLATVLRNQYGDSAIPVDQQRHFKAPIDPSEPLPVEAEREETIPADKSEAKPDEKAEIKPAEKTDTKPDTKGA